MNSWFHYGAGSFPCSNISSWFWSDDGSILWIHRHDTNCSAITEEANIQLAMNSLVDAGMAPIEWAKFRPGGQSLLTTALGWTFESVK